MFGKVLDGLEPLELWMRGHLGFGLWDRQSKRSWAQEGEDILFERLYPGVERGFYVDIGAHHPLRFSNTYRLYRRGWSGINVDPLPGSRRRFDLARPRDRNIEAAIGRREGSLWYHRFDEPALNTLSAAQAAHQAASSAYRLVDRIEVQIRTLAGLLKDSPPPRGTIDLLNVDVEGYEMEVLASNDWRRFRPRWIMAEALRCDFVRVPKAPVARFLAGKGYEPVARTMNTVFFRDRRP